MFNPFSRKNSEFKIDSDNHIIYVRFFGETFSSDVLRITKNILDNRKSIEDFNWVCDLSKSKQLFGLNQVESMAKIFVTNSDIFHNIKMAFIISSPKQLMSVDSLNNFFNINGINITIKKVIDKKQAYSWILNDKA
jgi:hypothetical protein